VKEERCRRLGELHRDHGELPDLPIVENGRQDEPSPKMRKKGGKQELCGGATDQRKQEVGGGGAQTIGHRGGGSYSHSHEGKMGDGGCTRVRAALEQGRARLAAGGASVKETRSYAACLLRLSRRVRW
jgi:hypothetical protein